MTNEASPCDPMPFSANPSLDGSNSDLASLFPNVPTSSGGLSPLSVNHPTVMTAGQPILNPGMYETTLKDSTRLFLA